MTDSTNELPDEAIEFANQLFDAARSGNTTVLVSAIDQGVPVDLADAQGNSFVMLAAYYGHAELVTELATRGADVNRANDRGQTPLAGAVFKKFDAVMQTLVDHGADVDAGAPSARQAAEMFGVELPER